MAERKLLLHIGTDKTGTTSIQETLHRGAREGRLEGVCYPSLSGRDHNLLAILYQPLERLPRTHRARYRERGHEALSRDAQAFRSGLFDQLERCERTILSGEYLWNFNPAEVEALATDLDRAGVQVRVVAYVRDPASHYLSSVQQTLKAASTYPSPEVWQRPLYRTLSIWRDRFPDLVVRPFLRDRLSGDDVVADFLEVAASYLGVPVDLPPVHRNQSISAEGMVLLQRYRRRFHPAAEDEFAADSDRLVEILQRSIDVIPQTRPRLRDEVRDLLLKRHEHDLDLIADEFGVDLRGAQTYRSVEPASSPGPERLDDLDLVLASYDPAIVEEVSLYCLGAALAAPDSLAGGGPSPPGTDAALRRELQRLQARLEETLASRSWRWGHRMVRTVTAPGRWWRHITGRPNP